MFQESELSVMTKNKIHKRKFQEFSPKFLFKKATVLQAL